MNEDTHSPAPVRQWLAGAMEDSAAKAIQRVRRANDVVYVAVLPDVHLAVDVCVGTATATRRLVYPSAVARQVSELLPQFVRIQL